MVSSPQTKTKTPEDAPPNFSELMSAIESSRRMLEWEDDWDGEGAIRYAESTWKRATDFITRSVLQLWQDYGVFADIPRVAPGPDGSIDIVWRTDKRKLLVNVPTDANELATFYGENNAHETVEGSLNTSSKNHWLLMWLVK